MVIRRLLSSVNQARQLMRTQGMSNGVRIALELKRKQDAIRFLDDGRSYWMPRDDATLHHLSHSVGSLRKLASFVDPGARRIIDVGAHSGLFAAFAAERAPDASVTLIEPNPRLAPLIVRNLRDHKNWQLIQVAVGDKPGRLTFYRNDSSSQTSSLILGAVEDFGDVVESSVAVTTLDDLLADDQPIDVLKVDVQGAEHMVVRGAAKTLLRVQILLIEASLLDSGVGEMLTVLNREFGPPARVNPLYVGADLAYVRHRTGLHAGPRPSDQDRLP